MVVGNDGREADYTHIRYVYNIYVVDGLPAPSRSRT
jgi:hypothetical protein